MSRIRLVLLKEQILLGVDKTNKLINTVNSIIVDDKLKVELP